MSVYSLFYLSVNQQSLCLFTHFLSVHLSACLFICPSVCLFICPSVCRFIQSLFICLFTHLSVCPFNQLSICSFNYFQFVHSLICLLVCMSILPPSVCLSIYFSTCMFADSHYNLQWTWKPEWRGRLSTTDLTRIGCFGTKEFSVRKETRLKLLVQGGQLYWSFPFRLESLVSPFPFGRKFWRQRDESAFFRLNSFWWDLFHFFVLAKWKTN
jgi:hypothetical protein